MAALEAISARDFDKHSLYDSPEKRMSSMNILLTGMLGAVTASLALSGWASTRKEGQDAVADAIRRDESSFSVRNIFSSLEHKSRIWISALRG